LGKTSEEIWSGTDQLKQYLFVALCNSL